MLKIFNSLNNQKEAFKPIHPEHVGMYVCGVTVYDFCHLGHARTYVAFDVIRRHLMSLGYEVKFVKNITDIDDKIIKRAAENNENMSELTTRMIEVMHEDELALNILPPDEEPKATEYIDKIQTLIKTLIDKGYAYLGNGGDVLFQVDKFKAYGKLSKKDLATLESGIRVAVDKQKHSPLDFVLWKKAKEGEPAWDSPWGAGRPGWHIECSAMAMDALGNSFDIHGGGFDLQFPHHENEIAQSEGVSGKPFANYWMHAGFLQLNEEKMSKSLGNFHTIRDTLKTYHPEILRYFFLSSHYRSQLNFTDASLQQAHVNLKKFYRACEDVLTDSAENLQALPEWEEKFIEVMNDDFNTPEALAVLFSLMHEINRVAQQDESLAKKLKVTLVALARRLGLLAYNAAEFLGEDLDASEIAAIESLLEKRNSARKNKDFALADKIRDELLQKGIEILDGPQGSSWRKS